MKPSTQAACVALALAPLYNWLLIFRAGLGLSGAALAMDAAQLTQLLALGVATCWRDRALRGAPEQTWHGWWVWGRWRRAGCSCMGRGRRAGSAAAKQPGGVTTWRAWLW